MKKIIGLLTLLSTLSGFTQTINSKIISSRGDNFRIFVNVDGMEEQVLETLVHLPKGTKITFDSNDSVIFPYYLNSQNIIRRSASRYYGNVKIISVPNNVISKQDIQMYNTYKLYVYQGSLDKKELIKKVYTPQVAKQDIAAAKLPTFAWDKVDNSKSWSYKAVEEVKEIIPELLETPPQDMTDFCPKYNYLSEQQKAFTWVALLNSIAKIESNFDPTTVNNESAFDSSLQVVSRGLLQISDGSIGRHYRSRGCNITSKEDLHNPVMNIRCGLAIISHLVAQDDVISKVYYKKNGKRVVKGVARYWSSLRPAYTINCSSCSSGVVTIGFKERISQEIRSLPFCQ